jgi:ATP adenylyltransferase
LISLLNPGHLWQELVARTETAKASGHLHTIDTDFHQLHQEGITFFVRVASHLKHKAKEKKQQPAFNPFLHPEPELTVCDLSPSHLTVLNKFNVVNHHLLIITRAFQSQELLLTPLDFEAWWRCLPEYPSLGFYNGGDAAGASQRHKHLQLVPLPLYQSITKLPIETLFKRHSPPGTLVRLEGLPFQHCWSRLPQEIEQTPVAAAELTYRLYRNMLHAAAIKALPETEGEKQSAPYNLLITKEWMLLIPRSQEYWGEISVNALGFVGSLFVQDQDSLARLKKMGPMNLLKNVSVS